MSCFRDCPGTAAVCLEDMTMKKLASMALEALQHPTGCPALTTEQAGLCIVSEFTICQEMVSPRFSRTAENSGTLSRWLTDATEYEEGQV